MRQETRTPLPTLNNLRIASPCEERWRDMEGDDRVRVCVKCEKRVYNFAALTRAEISELLIQTESAICTRLFQQSDGTILTADFPVGRASRIRRRSFSARVSALFLLGACVMTLGASMGPRTRANSSQLERARLMDSGAG
jgi:hypothetical protein